MLVLSRRIEEEIVIGPTAHPVRIKVCKLTADRVRLGFTSADDCEIYRSELLLPVETAGDGTQATDGP